jgi:glycosyltransferase involved in cell wall biosynthesis
MAVALCTFRGGAFLQEQLDSIQAQSRTPDAVVVVDDASDDDSVAVAERWGAAAPFPVRVHRNAERLGTVANFARALSLAADGGGVLVLADQDDVWLPRKLERLERAFRAGPTPGIVFSDAHLVDAEARRLGTRLWQAVGLDAAELARMEGGEALRVLARKSVVSGMAMALSAELLPLVLPIPAWCDHDAWIAMLAAAVGPVAAIPDPLVLYRQHGGNQVGARRLGLAERLKRARSERTEGLDRRRRMVSAARERLEAWPGTEPGALDVLREAEEHLQVRCRLPGPRARRVRAVAAELASGRYTRSSQGIASAVRDLLA